MEGQRQEKDSEREQEMFLFHFTSAPRSVCVSFSVVELVFTIAKC